MSEERPFRLETKAIHAGRSLIQQPIQEPCLFTKQALSVLEIVSMRRIYSDCRNPEIFILAL